MRVLILISVFFIGCASHNGKSSINNLDNTIPYIFPMDVEKVIANYLSDQNFDNVVGFLRRTNDHFEIYIVNSDSSFWTTNSRRNFFVDGEFYPLILDYDYNFGSNEPATSVKARLTDKSLEFPVRRNTLYHSYRQSFVVRFNKDGIVEQE